jgi:hypothetical protein
MTVIQAKLDKNYRFSRLMKGSIVCATATLAHPISHIVNSVGVGVGWNFLTHRQPTPISWVTHTHHSKVKNNVHVSGQRVVAKEKMWALLMITGYPRVYHIS